MAPLGHSGSMSWMLTGTVQKKSLLHAMMMNFARDERRV
jgi:hypothetical protein